MIFLLFQHCIIVLRVSGVGGALCLLCNWFPYNFLKNSLPKHNLKRKLFRWKARTLLMIVIASSAKMKVLELCLDCVWSQKFLTYDYVLKYLLLVVITQPEWTFLFHMDMFLKIKAIVNVFENLSSCSIEYITVLSPVFYFMIIFLKFS